MPKDWRPALPAPALAGGVLLLGLAVAALLAPWLAPYAPDAQSGLPFEPPSARHWLGTNDVGNDLLSELLYGARVSLLVGTLAGGIAVGIGAGVGLVAGYFGGWADGLLMRLADLVLVLPFLPLLVLLAAFVGPGFWTLVGVIALVSWARPARIIRSQALARHTQPYVLAARALGASDGRIMFRHILPGLGTLVSAQFVLAASVAILTEASLSFLGLGDPTLRSWGTMLYYAQAKSAFFTGAWVWWVLPPGVLIALTVFGFALCGLALEERANPLARPGGRRTRRVGRFRGLAPPPQPASPSASSPLDP